MGLYFIYSPVFYAIIQNHKLKFVYIHNCRIIIQSFVKITKKNIEMEKVL